MSDKPQWLIREDASVPVLVALALRQSLGIRAPEDLPSLRDLPVRAPDAVEASPALEEQWRDYWDMTVEPRAHPSGVPLELVDGFDTLVALPASGAEELATAIVPHAATALRYARTAHDRYVSSMKSHTGGDAYRAYASAIAEFEREIGRRAHSFELNVQVLPFSQRGIWWIGALTVAVTDGLRRDVVAFDAAVRPIIAELA
ncbi:zinc-binding alcohol dehydrogenase [Microbacterium hydrocarbonoxydans]|uniref:zinc-binding alcohol dehydrogenase n=1 Tax=Microbacterium hydrocarbonoxydans TaxID=273678 RepID=UPI0007BBA2D5|nr:zinc-binding alcohol dehydrogenase [Microbacterium hydrocarbonoxydans]GAT74394.1 Zn-dependent alcohol dehydrogenase [Microbacterium sp. HM58-2]